MRKGFVVRDRSLSSFPSRQMSSQQIRSQNSLAFHPNQTSLTFQESKTLLTQKNQDIFKLKNNLDYAIQMAVNEAIESSKAKQQSMRSTKTKLHVEKKFMEVTEQLNEEKLQKMKLQNQMAGLQYELNKELQEKKKLAQINQKTSKQLNQAKRQLTKIQLLQQKLTQIQPLKKRIKILQIKMRQQKLKQQETAAKNNELQKQIENLKHIIKMAKPKQQEHLQRIALLERINLQLQRKMQDYYRREQQFRKQISVLKKQLAKMTSDRNNFKQLYDKTYQTLQQKLAYIADLQQKLAEQIKNNQLLNKDLQQKTKQNELNAQKLIQTINYFKTVAEQNQFLKKRNIALQQHQLQMRKVIAQHLKASEEINLYIMQRNSYITKLQDEKKYLKQLLEQLQKKFIKLDRLFDEGSARGQNEIKQSYYGMLKQKDKLNLQLKQLKQQMAIKILQFGEQRDILQRKVNAYQLPLPKDQTLFDAIIADKIQAIIMLQSSNDQLIKIKNQLYDRMKQIQLNNQALKKQMQNLRLKAAELFKTKKDLQETRERAQRYHNMIEQQRIQIADLNSQLDVMRTNNSQSAQKIFVLGIEVKNLNFKITEYENVMKQLDVQYLNAKKIQNERNVHIISDAVQKMNSGITSLAYYFSCCFCDQLLTNPVTLACCGHSYCQNQKCKDAYAQYCYECDTGQPIQKVYSSKFFKQASGKYKFLTMVFKQAQNNLIKINAKN